jgi:type IV pilus assembly protein PilQ
LHDVLPRTAFDLLLQANGLGRRKVGETWLIAPLRDLMKEVQIENEWHLMLRDTTQLTSRIWQIQYAKAKDIAALIDVSKRGQVKVDERTNILYVEDIPSQMQKIASLIQHLDVPIKQIIIHARLISIDSDYERQLGLQFAVKSNTNANQDILSYSLAVAKLADGSLLDVKLLALEDDGHAELISSPSLSTANQQTASIEAGEEVPYQEVSDSGGTAIVFKKAVLGLTVTPQILPGNKILLQLKINQDRPSNNMVLGMPTISTRAMTTSIEARDGETIVLGGIYETDEEKEKEGIPIINRIPLLKALFSNHQTKASKRELLIFVTPKIMS